MWKKKHLQRVHLKVVTKEAKRNHPLLVAVHLSSLWLQKEPRRPSSAQTSKWLKSSASPVLHSSRKNANKSETILKMTSVTLFTHFPSSEKISPWNTQIQYLVFLVGSRILLGEKFKRIGISFLLPPLPQEKVNQQMNVEALTGKACPDWSVEKKNMVITRQILQFQVYITFMGQWGKNTAQLLKLSSVCSQQSQTLHYLCSKSQ